MQDSSKSFLECHFSEFIAMWLYAFPSIYRVIFGHFLKSYFCIFARYYGGE